MRIVRVAVTGFGVVGRATSSLILSRRERYRSVYGVDLRIVAVCTSRYGLHDDRGLEQERFEALEHGVMGPDLVARSGADILIEAGPSDFRTGGVGLGYIRAALSNGKDAIVISKGALVYDGRALRHLSRSSGAKLMVSAAAGAALPGLDLLQRSLKGCVVHRVEGILNATTNYLLDTMMTRGIGLDAALLEAQAGAFVERDPSLDVEGFDTACKLLILSNFGLGTDLVMGDLKISGIRGITPSHIADWTREGVIPKLVGTLWRRGGDIEAQVDIRLLLPVDPLARVSGKDKGIRIEADEMGEVVAVCSGPEPIATAAAAAKDLERILEARSRVD